MSIENAFEVRLKKPNGQIVSRHYENLRDQGQAEQRARKSGIGRIISVKKVKPELILGNAQLMGVDKLIGVHSQRYDPQEGIVFENTSIEEIMFTQYPHKAKRLERRRFKQRDKREFIEE